MKVLPIESSATHPICIAGKRACPPEDIGGIWGYKELLEVSNNPDHPEYENLMDWAGEDFDPTEFDIQAVNAKLAGLPK